MSGKPEEIVRRIKKINLGDLNQPIPTSEILHKKHMHDLCGEDLLEQYLEILKEAHYIFIIRIVDPNETSLPRGISGYVVTETSVVSKMRKIGRAHV